MDTTSVHNILSAITEAKVALDREPEYKAQIESLERTLSKAQVHSQELELGAISYRIQIEELELRVRSLEVERDDASFRNLELEDTLTSYRVQIDAFNSSIAHLMPVVALPEPEEVKPELLPSVEPVVINYDTTTMSNQVVGDVSGPLPPSTTPSAPMTESMPASVSSVQEPSSALDTSTELPYKNKRRSEVPSATSYCTLEQWYAGGGTASDYWN